MKAVVMVVVAPPGNMNAIIVALSFQIKQRLIGICYFAGPWRIYDAEAMAVHMRACQKTH
jgi:hypothetical protein